MINILDKKIKAIHRPRGYDSDKEKAKKVLVEGREYTVKSIEVGGWRTDVQLLEVGKEFNSVMFDFYDSEGNSIDIVDEYEKLFGY